MPQNIELKTKLTMLLSVPLAPEFPKIKTQYQKGDDYKQKYHEKTENVGSAFLDLIFLRSNIPNSHFRGGHFCHWPQEPDAGTLAPLSPPPRH